MFRGKKYQESAKLIDKSAQYEAAEGMDLICKTAKAKFDETVELHVKLGVDSRHADQQVRGATGNACVVSAQTAGSGQHIGTNLYLFLNV